MAANTDRKAEWGYIKNTTPPAFQPRSAASENGDNATAVKKPEWISRFKPPADASYDPYQPALRTKGQFVSDPHVYDPPPRGLPKGKAVAALILGIASFFYVAFITGPLAIILGGVCIGQCNRGEASGKGMAIAGVVLGALFTAGWIIMLAVHKGLLTVSYP